MSLPVCQELLFEQLSFTYNRDGVYLRTNLNGIEVVPVLPVLYRYAKETIKATRKTTRWVSGCPSYW